MFKKAVSILCIGALAGIGCFALSGCQSQPSQNSNVSVSSDNGNDNTEVVVLTPSGDQSILKISYHYNFAEVGNGWSYELVRTDGDEDTLYLAQVGFSNNKYNANQSTCADSVLDKIEEICTLHGIYEWPETLASNVIQHADRSEKFVVIEYEDGQKRSFSTQDALPAGGEEAINEIASVLEGTVDID